MLFHLSELHAAEVRVEVQAAAAEALCVQLGRGVPGRGEVLGQSAPQVSSNARVECSRLINFLCTNGTNKSGCTKMELE